MWVLRYLWFDNARVDVAFLEKIAEEAVGWFEDENARKFEDWTEIGWSGRSGISSAKQSKVR